MTKCAASVIATCCVVSVCTALMTSSDATSRIRDDLTSRAFAFEGMSKLFRLNPEASRILVKALDDQDNEINSNAQWVLRLQGNEAGVSALSRWYQHTEHARIVNGPVNVPLRHADYEFVQNNMLGHPYSDWRGSPRQYVLALILDGTPRATKTLRNMIDAMPADVRHVTEEMETQAHITVKGCGPRDPTKWVVRRAFFLEATESNQARVELLAFSSDRRKALLKISQPLGDLYLVVLNREGNCWKFQSVSVWAES